MDKSTYHRKREELVRKYPLYMSEKWLRNTRIGFVVLLVICVKITQSSLVS